MSNLFSVFDPQTHSFLWMNWISGLVVLSLLPASFWLSFSRAQSCLSGVKEFIVGEFRPILGTNTLPGTSLVMVGMFVYILLNNVFGLSPYTFTATAHLSFAFSLALPLWMGHVIYAWAKCPEDMFAHLVPLGTPVALMPFMVIIELISSVIRPLTLSVRLAANMVAGHLLLTLLSSQGVSGSSLIVCLLMSALVLLGALESAVALIQAYVFSVLSTLYVSEIDPVKVA